MKRLWKLLFLLLDLRIIFVAESKDLRKDRSTLSPFGSRRTIVGGNVADPQRYPYFVRLEYSGYLGCGGTLVWPDLVLTAAHCAYDEDVDPQSMVALVGEKERRTIRRVIPHPAYDDPTNQYDVAVLKLNEPILGVPLVALAQSDHLATLQQTSSSDTVNVTVIGFGATADDSRNSNVLREAHIQIVSDETCQKFYNRGDIHGPSMLCAAHAEEWQGPCYRDSGGPLLFLGNTQLEIEANKTLTTTARTVNETLGRDLQLGIISWGGERCADPNQPGVYADVAHVQPWVERVICRYGLEPPVDCENEFSLTDDINDDWGTAYDDGEWTVDQSQAFFKSQRKQNIQLGILFLCSTLVHLL